MKAGFRYYYFPASAYLLELCPDYVRYVCLETGLVLYSVAPGIIERWEGMETEKNRIGGGDFRVMFESVINYGDLPAQ